MLFKLNNGKKVILNKYNNYKIRIKNLNNRINNYRIKIMN